jgi:hypothetical protein
VLFVAVSFFLGLLFKKAEIDLSYAMTDELGKRYLLSLDAARANGGVLPPEAVESAQDWRDAVHEVSKNQAQLQRFGNWPSTPSLLERS